MGELADGGLGRDAEAGAAAVETAASGDRGDGAQPSAETSAIKISNAAERMARADAEANPEESISDSIARNIFLKDEVERARIDYFNDRMEAAQARIREAELEQNEEMARAWREQREAIMAKEREQARWLADFWLAYFKQKMEIENSGGSPGSTAYDAPSALNFGLL